MPMQNRSAESRAVDTVIGPTGMPTRQLRVFVIGAAICAIGAGASGSRTALAQVAGNVGARCSISSDCRSGVCHPATHLCMISAAAAQPPSTSCDANSACSSARCNAPSEDCMPKPSGNGPVGAGCQVSSDCLSGVCHPATHLCMVSAAAGKPPSTSCNINSDCDSGMCNAASHQCAATHQLGAVSRSSRSSPAVSAVHK
jgi:hypothetical protein